MHPELYPQRLFNQLRSVLQQLDDSGYTRPLPVLSGGSIGAHIRHIAELYLELLKGYPGEVVNYGKRERDPRLEQDRCFAIQVLDKIETDIRKPDKWLRLETEPGPDDGPVLAIATNYYRELLYTAEHTIHHMALIRAGLYELGHPTPDDTFGVAPATINYRNRICAR